MEEVLLYFILIAVVLVLIMRMFGAWMLRINEIIDLQRDTLKELKRINPGPPDEPRS